MRSIKVRTIKKSRMRTKLSTIALLASLALAFCAIPAAHAGLSQVGPIDPVGGYPDWYMDSNGVALEMCLDGPARCANTPVIPGNQASIDAGFGDEAFYWLGTAATPLCSQVVLALETIWSGGTPAPGTQQVMSRFRVRCTRLTEGGIYTLVSPFQNRRVAATALPVGDPNGPFEINFSDDDIGGAGNGFSTSLGSPNVGPFLKAANAPAGFLGTGGAPSLVTGGTNGNSFQLLSPGGAVVTQTSRWVIVGKLATNGGLSDTTATYSRTATGAGAVFAHAHSIGGQRIVAAGVGPTQVRLLPVAGDFGHYEVSIPFGPNRALPLAVTVRNATDASNPIVTIDPVVDVVTISSATWSAATQTLTVVARSSDRTTGAQRAILTVIDPATGTVLGRVNRRGVFTLVTGPVRPATVRVTSNKGGRDSLRVTVVP